MSNRYRENDGLPPRPPEGSSGPYGHIGDDIAHVAKQLIGYLTPGLEIAVDSSSEWQEADHKALELWLNLESDARLMEVPYEVDGETRGRVTDTFLAFHTALPFNEAERGWFGDMRENLTRVRHEELPRVIKGLEDEMIIAGVRRIVSGRDLMRRWIAWRRETDEFEDQGSLNQAREALQRLSEQLG